MMQSLEEIFLFQEMLFGWSVCVREPCAEPQTYVLDHIDHCGGLNLRLCFSNKASLFLSEDRHWAIRTDMRGIHLTSYGDEVILFPSFVKE